MKRNFLGRSDEYLPFSKRRLPDHALHHAVWRYLPRVTGSLYFPPGKLLPCAVCIYTYAVYTEVYTAEKSVLYLAASADCGMSVITIYYIHNRKSHTRKVSRQSLMLPSVCTFAFLPRNSIYMLYGF